MKNYVAEFELDSKILATIFICYKYKYPLSFMLSFYEMYGDKTLFALKALSCSKKSRLSDNELVKILEESRKLFLQIQRGITIKNKIKQIKKGTLEEELPEEPKFNLESFSLEYVDFVENYLLKNIDDIYAPKVKLNMSPEDVYGDIFNA